MKHEIKTLARLLILKLINFLKLKGRNNNNKTKPKIETERNKFGYPTIKR